MLTLLIILFEFIVSTVLLLNMKYTTITGWEFLYMVQSLRSTDDQLPLLWQRLLMLTPKRKLGCSLEQGWVTVELSLLFSQNSPSEKLSLHAKWHKVYESLNFVQIHVSVNTIPTTDPWEDYKLVNTTNNQITLRTDLFTHVVALFVFSTIDCIIVDWY